jgi:hypothetical protein
MKFPFLSAVVGTSFRPATAMTTKPGSPIIARPEPDNPVDPLAVLIEIDGEQLGYLPRALAARLTGGPWAGEIVEVFGVDRLGIRVRILGPLSQHPTFPQAQVRKYLIDPTMAVNRTVSRSSSQTEKPTSVHTPEKTTSKSLRTAPSTSGKLQTRVDVRPVGIVVLDGNEIVRARSGRILGTFVSSENGKVLVRTDDGRDVNYPENLIIRERRVS